MFIAGCGSDDSAIEQSEDIEVVDVEEVIDINDYILDGWEFYEAYEIDPLTKFRYGLHHNSGATFSKVRTTIGENKAKSILVREIKSNIVLLEGADEEDIVVEEYEAYYSIEYTCDGYDVTQLIVFPYSDKTHASYFMYSITIAVPTDLDEEEKEVIIKEIDTMREALKDYEESLK